MPAAHFLQPLKAIFTSPFLVPDEKSGISGHYFSEPLFPLPSHSLGAGYAAAPPVVQSRYLVSASELPPPHSASPPPHSASPPPHSASPPQHSASVIEPFLPGHSLPRPSRARLHRLRCGAGGVQHRGRRQFVARAVPGAEGVVAAVPAYGAGTGAAAGV
ncbi:hypothetical protein H6P81_010229 [Aristolochia fimbriata]|uniref:Uncharacterized protein n=1 Tax=Aristolochia fimbriata TaxID=158543 RepID=A0AAV7EPD9_ARIFI|nr:hypothetical protein H6P81_010229 [Aristolochia fimbriata]